MSKMIELIKKSNEELKQELSLMKAKLYDLRVSFLSKQEQTLKVHLFQDFKKRIARIKTLLTIRGASDE